MAAPGSCGILRDMSGVLYFRNTIFTSSKSGNMKTRGFILMFAVLCLSNVRAQTPGPVNYDEQKVPQYRLPDVLTCADGTPVTSRRQWEHRRRGEVLQLLAEQEYGITPRGRVRMDCRVLRENPQALGGLATSQQVMLTFTGQGRSVQALLLAYYPNRRGARTCVHRLQFQR